jgi:hypothetical protein
VVSRSRTRRRGECAWASTTNPDATSHNDDGTTSFITITRFVVGDRAGKPILTIRDAQHEYVFE